MYPISLNLTEKPCLVVGGGTIASRKIQRLLKEAAKVTVVAPTVTEAIDQWHQQGKLTWEQRSYQSGEFLAGYFLVFCATDNLQLNEEIARAAKLAGALVNVITSPQESDFVVPASLVQGRLQLTVDTGGLSPALSRWIRQDLAQRYHPGWGDFLASMAQLRDELKQTIPDTKVRTSLWRNLMTPEIWNLVINNEVEKAENDIRHKISSAGIELPHRTSGDTRKI